MESNFPVTLISSLSTHGCIQLVFTQCIHRFPKWSSSIKAVFFVPVFPTGLKALGLMKDKTSKDQVEGSIQSLSPLTKLPLVTVCTAPLSSRQTFFPVFPLLSICLLKTLLPSMSFTWKFNSRWALPFLTSSLHAQAVYLYFSWVTCPSFHLLFEFIEAWQSSCHLCFYTYLWGWTIL